MSKIGKLIGGCLYVHREYENEIPSGVLKAARRAARGFAYDVVKWDKKTDAVTFVQVPTFDSEPEPRMGAALLVKADGSTKAMPAGKDPWVYHHKASFVGADYTGFDIARARARQLAIDKTPGVDKSRIGKYSVNKAVTAGLGKPGHTVEKRAEKYKVDKTSIPQIPAIFKTIKWTAGTRNADVGGGKYDLGTDYLKEQGVASFIYDPFSRPGTFAAVGKLLLAKPADTGTMANVLNVIEDHENRINALRDLRHMVKPGATVYIGIYAGNGKGKGGATKIDTWQNHRDALTYVDDVAEVFDVVKVTTKMITAKAPAAGLSGVNTEYSLRWGVSEDVIQALRVEINRVLSRATASTYPAVYARLDQGGYLSIEESVIGVVLSQNITPGSALALLDSEWEI